MFDAQINQKNWLKKIIKETIYFFFLKSSIKKIISTIVLYFKYLYFFNRKKINHVKKNIVNSSEVLINEENEQKFERIFNLRNKKNIILKIDIEGNEYRILDEIINNQVVNTDLNFFAEFTLKFSNESPLLYGAFAIILAISLGAFAAWTRKFMSPIVKKLLSEFRNKDKSKKNEVKFPEK